MCTKKSILVLSVIGSVPVVYLFMTGMYDYKNLFLALFIFPLVFFFSLVTYFLPEAVFRSWARFTTWWVALQIIAVALTPESSGGYFVSIVDKQLVAIGLSALFALISVILILFKWLSVRRA